MVSTIIRHLMMKPMSFQDVFNETQLYTRYSMLCWERKWEKRDTFWLWRDSHVVRNVLLHVSIPRSDQRLPIARKWNSSVCNPKGKKKIPLYAPTLPPTELPYAISVSSQTKFPMFVSFLIVLVRVVQGEKKSIGGDFYRKWPMWL